MCGGITAGSMRNSQLAILQKFSVDLSLMLRDTSTLTPGSEAPKGYRMSERDENGHITTSTNRRISGSRIDRRFPAGKRRLKKRKKSAEPPVEPRPQISHEPLNVDFEDVDLDEALEATPEASAAPRIQGRKISDEMRKALEEERALQVKRGPEKPAVRPATDRKNPLDHSVKVPEIHALPEPEVAEDAEVAEVAEEEKEAEEIAEPEEAVEAEEPAEAEAAEPEEAAEEVAVEEKPKEAAAPAVTKAEPKKLAQSARTSARTTTETGTKKETGDSKSAAPAAGPEEAPAPPKTRLVFKIAGILILILIAWIGVRWIAYGKSPLGLASIEGQEEFAADTGEAMVGVGAWVVNGVASLFGGSDSGNGNGELRTTDLSKGPETASGERNKPGPVSSASKAPSRTVAPVRPAQKPAPATKPSTSRNSGSSTRYAGPAVQVITERLPGLAAARDAHAQADAVYKQADPTKYDYKTVQKSLRLAMPHFERCIDECAKARKQGIKGKELDVLEQSASMHLYDCQKRCALGN